MKSIIASGILLGLAHGAAIAGPYVNVENNAGFFGSEFSGTVTDFHIGYEGEAGPASYYIQGGPSIFAPDGAEAETLPTGKLGASIAATEKLSVYGEVSATFDDTNSYGTKAGVKYKF
tara:strand:+ start:444 stop:797 length:354 start_codon:yes stop_codon:yes gene_type:complete